MLSGFQIRFAAPLLLALSSCMCSIAQEPKLAQLLQRSPLPANSICYLHTPSLSKLLAAANIELELSAKVEEVWLVSELNTASLAPSWEAGYATIEQQPEADALANSLGGYVDQVEGQKVIWTPRQSYVLPISQDRIGFLRPARRDLLAKWIDSSNNSPVPDFLASQSRQPESYLSLLLAVNLRNTFSPVSMAGRVGTFDSLKGQDPKAMAELLASVQGVSIIVGRNSLTECVLAIEFGQSPTSLKPIASALVSEMLNRNGTSAPEVASWKPRVDGNKLLLQGPLSADSLDGILNIFSLSNYAENVAKRLTAPAEQPAETEMLSATQEYFSKVNAYIERVRKYEAQSTGYRAKWDEQQARRIDELGTLNVDPLMIDYGANVASILRNNATAIRTGNVAAGQIQASQANDRGYVYGYGGGYYGGYYAVGYNYRDARYGVSDQAITGAQQRMGGFGSYREAIAAIDKMTGDVRRAMTDKYKVQF